MSSAIWTKEEDECLRENYPTYKSLNSVFEMLSTFLDDKHTAEEVACRLFQLQIIDKFTFTDSFPSVELPSIVEMEGIQFDTIFLEEIAEGVKNALNFQKEEQIQSNGIQWVSN